MTTTLAFIDRNANRDNWPEPVVLHGDGFRLIYDRIWEGTDIVATYREGNAPDGSGDGWEHDGALFSDVEFWSS